MGIATAPRAGNVELARLMVVVSRLYHVHGFRQRDIADRLGISQARVSRLLQQATSEGIVKRVVAVPEGLRPDLEEEVERRYGVHEVHLVDCEPHVQDVSVVLGRAAAAYLAEVPPTGLTIGFTSWSGTLQEMAHALAPSARTVAAHVVEMLGDLGSPLLQHGADRATQAMARALGAEPVFLRTPGVLATAALHGAARNDPHVQRALGLLDSLDVAFVGVGPAAVHSRLQAGDCYFTPEQLDLARRAGAVGQLNQRFIDRAGRAVETPLDELVVGSTLEQLRAARRRVVVAGGEEKTEAIAAALRGRWVDVLITDLDTGRALLGDFAPRR